VVALIPLPFVVLSLRFAELGQKIAFAFLDDDLAQSGVAARP